MVLIIYEQYDHRILFQSNNKIICYLLLIKISHNIFLSVYKFESI